MNEYDDLNTYNGDAEHDMWVDYTTNQNTGELEEYFDDEYEEDYDDEYEEDYDDEY